MPLDEITREREKAERRVELESLKPISHEQFVIGVKEHLLIVDENILKLLPALIIANRFKGRDAIWAMLIGPSGGGKTELLNMILDLEEVYLISTLTPQTFLSGMPGKKDTSLLPLLNGKIMIFKDWTSIMSMRWESKNEMYGQFREVYDGKATKNFGNGITRTWEGKVGLIAGVTPAYDILQQTQATLGERFINYRLVMPDRELVAYKAFDNAAHIIQTRKALANLSYAYMKGVKMPETEPALPEGFRETIVPITNFATMARSGVIRELSNKREVIYVPAPEMPTRSVQVFSAVATALQVMGVEIGDIIYRIALDSIPDTNYMVIKVMARGKEQTTKDIATELGYPTPPIRTYLENLALLGVCKRIKAEDSVEGGTADKWTLNNRFNDIVHTYEKIKRIDEIKIAEQEKIIDKALDARKFEGMEETTNELF